MDRLQIGSIAVATGANAALGAVPTWTAVVVLLAIGCIPPLCRLIECIDGVIWRWKRGCCHCDRCPTCNGASPPPKRD